MNHVCFRIDWEGEVGTFEAQQMIALPLSRLIFVYDDVILKPDTALVLMIYSAWTICSKLRSR
jgi:hypothetical protein